VAVLSAAKLTVQVTEKQDSVLAADVDEMRRRILAAEIMAKFTEAGIARL
jgi:hypothetical protein